MKLLEHVIPLPTIASTVTIVPFGCVHADDPGFDADLFEECLDTIVRTPHCYAVGLGDYHTLARTTYRKHLASYRADEDSQRQLDTLAETQTRQFYRQYLQRIPAGKLLGLAEGNHYWSFIDGTTDTQLLCRLAKVPYLEKGSLHRLVFRHRSGHGIRVLTMLVHHGDWGGTASTTGGDINSMEGRGRGWDVDLVVFGHTHRKAAYAVPVLGMPLTGRLQIKERPRAYVRAGCFTKGYVERCITYVERRLMPPTALGWVTIQIEFFQKYSAEARARAKARRGPLTGGVCGPVEYRFRFTL